VVTGASDDVPFGEWLGIGWKRTEQIVVRILTEFAVLGQRGVPLRGAFVPLHPSPNHFSYLFILFNQSATIAPVCFLFDSHPSVATKHYGEKCAFAVLKVLAGVKKVRREWFRTLSPGLVLLWGDVPPAVHHITAGNGLNGCGMRAILFAKAACDLSTRDDEFRELDEEDKEVARDDPMGSAEGDVRLRVMVRAMQDETSSFASKELKYLAETVLVSSEALGMAYAGMMTFRSL